MLLTATLGTAQNESGGVPKQAKQPPLPEAVQQALRQLATGDRTPAMLYLRSHTHADAGQDKLAEALIPHLNGRKHVAQDFKLLDELAGMSSQLASGRRAHAHYQKAALHQARGNHEAAVAAMHQCRLTEPAWAGFAASYLTSLHLNKGDLTKAWQEFERFRSFPGTVKSEIATREADLLLAAGQCNAAARKLRQAGFPEPVPGTRIVIPETEALAFKAAQELWVDIAMWSEQFESAIALIEELDKIGIDRPRLRFGHAHSLHRLQKANGAELLRALATDSSIPLGYRMKSSAMLANEQLQAGDHEAAAAILERLPAGSSNLEVDITLARVALARHAALPQDAEQRTAAEQRVAACAAVLETHWQNLTEQWHNLRVVPGGLAFLQLAIRRDLLTACLQCDAVLAPATAADAAWTRLLTIDAANTLARQLELQPVDLAAIREHVVPENGALIAYLPARGSSHILWLTATEAAVLPMASDDGLRVNVQSLRAQLRRANVNRSMPLDELHSLAQRVADAVLPDALRERLATVDRIAIHGRELVTGLPFECLPWPGPDHAYLGLAKALHYHPCLTLATELARRTHEALTVDLVVAAASSHADDAAAHHVPATTLDASRLQQLQPVQCQATRQAALSNDATTTANLFAPTETIGALALFAHGIFDSKRPRPAGLLLARGNDDTGAVFADTLPNDARAPARMVVLCTCGAARGSLQRGDDGSRHLGGALMQLGTQVVGIADGDLEVHGTERLVSELFAELSYGEAPDQALLAARRSIARDGHIADWSLVRLEGLAARPLLEPAHTEPTRPQRAQSTRWLSILASPWFAAGTALILLALFRKRFRG